MRTNYYDNQFIKPHQQPCFAYHRHSTTSTLAPIVNGARGALYGLHQTEMLIKRIEHKIILQGVLKNQ